MPVRAREDDADRRTVFFPEDPAPLRLEHAVDLGERVTDVDGIKEECLGAQEDAEGMVAREIVAQAVKLADDDQPAMRWIDGGINLLMPAVGRDLVRLVPARHPRSYAAHESAPSRSRSRSSILWRPLMAIVADE